MLEHKKIPTTPEVWAVIRARHWDDLVPFSSFSAPEGNYFGNSREGLMFTEYGFKEAVCPLIGAETRWDFNHLKPYERKNERHEYWLCVPINSDA